MKSRRVAVESTKSGSTNGIGATAASGPPRPGKGSIMLESLRTRLDAWFAYAITVHKLRELDDRLLVDMGIPRQTIRRQARAAAFGPGGGRR